MIKGWKVNQQWRYYFENRERDRLATSVQIETMRAQQAAMASEQEARVLSIKASARALEIQEEQHTKWLETDRLHREHMAECHAEKVATGEIQERKTN